MTGRMPKRQLKKSFEKMLVIDEEQLIRLVASRPILYDKSLKAYRKTGIRQQVWKEVGTEMGGITVDECRRRWRSLRDAFTKHYKQSVKTSPGIESKRKKWIFFDQMSFMAPYLQKSSFNIDQQLLDCFPDNSNSDDQGDIECASNILKFEEKQASSIENDKTLHTHNVESCRKIGDTMKGEPLLKVCLDSPKALDTTKDVCDNGRETHHTFEEVQYSSLSVDVDLESNEKFLLSCVPVLKRLSHQKNSLARLRIQKLLYEIEFGEYN